jgi:glucose/arabinose dehydrogenase
MKRQGAGAWVLGLLVLLFFHLPNSWAQLVRERNTTLAMPSAPPQRGFALQQAFPITFSAPVAITAPPGETNRLFIVEQVGRIIVITNLAAPTRTVFMDISSRILFNGEQGLLGLAFHPDFKNNGIFFVDYTTTGTRNDRLARYKVSAANPNAGDPSSEVILINQFDEASNHNAGDLHFGPDGYLYVSLGDEGDAGDSFQNSQRIDKDFFSGMLRIDVDKKPGNLVPTSHPASTTNYFVPADNPFVGATSFNGVALADPSKVHTEFWAVGLRNPWRYSFDPATGALWLGDVGQNVREEVDIIVKGGNYGWNFREGNIAYAGTPPPGFHPIAPIYDYDRSGGNCVIGGVVYRGSRLSQLYGAYIFGDNGSGNVWSLRTNTTGAPTVQRLTGTTGLSAFGVDPSNGDVLLCDVVGGIIRRLTYSATTIGAPLPATLADTGAFADLAALTPQAGIVAYEINLPFWSDGATKKRWSSIPNLTDKFGFDPTNAWQYPTGAVWIKHFEIQTNDNPIATRRLETRFIVRNTSGVYGVTYRWTNSNSAALVAEEGLDEPLVITEGGIQRTQVWHYPSRSECLTCHNASAGWVLGFNAPQLNREMTYGSETTNQIVSLAKAGYLTSTPTNYHALLALAHPDDAEVSQEFRVRSYLNANCAQCHRPGGPGLGNFDARIGTPTDAANLIDGALNDNLGDPQNRVLVAGSTAHSVLLQRMSIRGQKQMPPIASNVPDPAGSQLLSNFVTGELLTRKSFAQWQTNNFGSSVAANGDPDADGASNLLEWLADTNPNQPGDGWSIRARAGQGGAVEIVFTNPANRGVVIEASDADFQNWTPVEAPGNRLLFPITPKEVVIPNAVDNGQARFYRAQIIAP